MPKLKMSRKKLEATLKRLSNDLGIDMHKVIKSPEYYLRYLKKSSMCPILEQLISLVNKGDIDEITKQHIESCQRCSYLTDLTEAARKLEGLFEVTHFIMRPPQKGVWLPLAFFTRRKDSKVFFLGFGTNRKFTQEEVEVDCVCSLPTPRPIRPGKSLWLADDGSVWLANEDDPMGDPAKVQLKERKNNANEQTEFSNNRD